MDDFSSIGNSESEDSEQKKKKITWISLPKNKTELLKMNFKGILHPAMKMAYQAMKIQRSPKQAFIFLIGDSGSGKSSTVNYLFDENIAKVNKSTSEQRSTTEYVVTMESEEWQIPDLTLSVVDTPGFGDTEGLEQDVKNWASVLAFRKQHPHLHGYFPNLIFLVMKITDNRTEGPNSKFSKLLKSLDVLKVVDKKNPNLIVVLTHAAMFPPNQKKFESRVEEVKSLISGVVETLLDIKPLIVIQENKPEDYDLEEEGDWHILPNKERQPLSLFTACKAILNLANDEICHEALSVYFRSTTRNKPTVGMSFDGSTLKTSQLSEIRGAILEPIFPSIDSEITNLLDKYAANKSFPFMEFEIPKLKMRLKGIGITTAEQLQSMTMNQLKIRIKPTHISPHMEKILEDAFGLKYEQMCGLDCGIGKGYNLFTDSILQKTPYDLDDSKTGKLGLPENVRFKHCHYYEIKCEEVENQNHYVTERLKGLNIEGGPYVNFSKFSMNVRGGFNLRNQNETSKNNSKIGTSFSVEQRIYKITLPESISFTGEFIASVADLPQTFDECDSTNVEKWSIFMQKWGYFIVNGMYLGGAVSGCMYTEEERRGHNKSNSKSALAKLSAKLLSFNQDGLINLDGECRENYLIDENSSFISSALQWIGGDKCPKTASFEKIEKGDWDLWLDSLEYNPAPLSTSLDLCPIYILVEKLDKDKCLALKEAMEKEIFVDTDKNLRPNFFQIMSEVVRIHMTLMRRNQKNLLNTRNAVAASNPSGGCFDGSSSMYLSNGKQVKMENSSIGDKVLSVDKFGNLVKDTIIAWLHKVPNGPFQFLQIDHSFGSLVITKEHLLFIGKDRKPALASSVKRHDEISVLTGYDDNQSLVLAKVLAVKEVQMTGLYAPLTMSGNVIVNGVFVSCYCRVQPFTLMGKEVMSSQSIAHLALLPLRLAYKLRKNKNGRKTDRTQGIHPYAKAIMNITGIGLND